MTAAKPGSLAEALAMLQADLPQVDKSKQSQAGHKKYNYADLDAVTKVLMPRMAALGLCFVACPNLDDQGRFTLDCKLLHVSGESVGGSYPLPAGGSPQAIGMAITYARRYFLCAVTGLASGTEDDDGKQATQEHNLRASQQTPAQQRASRGAPPPRAGAERKRAIEHERLAASTRDTGGVMAPGPIPDEDNIWQGPPPDGENAPGSISQGQHRAIEMLLTQMGIPREDRTGRHAAVFQTILGVDLTSFSEMSFVQGKDAINALQDLMARERAGA
jgi:ERF superfamily